MFHLPPEILEIIFSYENMYKYDYDKLLTHLYKNVPKFLYESPHPNVFIYEHNLIPDGGTKYFAREKKKMIFLRKQLEY